MVKTRYFDVCRWKKEFHINTSGTRNKHILTSPQGDKYFFKKSLFKPGKDYKYEFWSEIIASQVGQYLGFNVVTYDVAYFKNEIGCISKSIIKINNEELSEGYGYIIEKYPDFKTNFKRTHSFQKIVDSLKNIHLENLISDVIKMIVFDAIIGNSDRHSENWAIVISNKKLLDTIEQYSRIKKLKLNLKLLLLSNGRFTFSRLNKLLIKESFKFSPFYDNGSSLARELKEQKIEELLFDNNKFETFVKKGKPDIRWNDENINHFDLLLKIRSKYSNDVNAIINSIKQKYNKQILINIVNNVDKKLPSHLNEFKLTSNRKGFIIKYIDARINIILKLDEQI